VAKPPSLIKTVLLETANATSQLYDLHDDGLSVR
jgi:hypothetical protein